MCLAVPGRVLDTCGEGFSRMATVDFGGVRKEVSLAYLPEAQVGEYVIVHVGFALQRLDEASALATLDLFRRTGVLAEELGVPEPRSDSEMRVEPPGTEVPIGLPVARPGGTA